MRNTVFVVEDDEDIAELLKFNLDKEGFIVKLEANGEKAYDEIIAQPPDLLVLDLNLPGLSGIEICKYLRENARTRDLPIIMLTARTQEIDKIIGFQMGADDYVTKPFSIRELIARIHALLRRTSPAQIEKISIGDLHIYLNRHKVTCGEKGISLTPTEYKLLEALVMAKGRVLSRSDLMDMAWGLNYYGETRTVDVHIKRLRDKLENCANLIETVKGTGYRLMME
jgi:phosphate regulon transcriptional regulator PhoB